MKLKGKYIVLLLIILAAISGGCVGENGEPVTVVNNQQEVRVGNLTLQMVGGEWYYSQSAVIKISYGPESTVVGFSVSSNKRTVTLDGSVIKIEMRRIYPVEDQSGERITAADFEIWR